MLKPKELGRSTEWVTLSKPQKNLTGQAKCKSTRCTRLCKYRSMESVRLEKTSKIIKSNHKAG